jgi:hypothetical protein
LQPSQADTDPYCSNPNFDVTLNIFGISLALLS